MLTPVEILRQATAKYPAFVSAYFRAEPFFPLEIRFGRPDAGASLGQLRADIDALLSQSKGRAGFGYSVEMASRKTRSHGEQSLPARVWFDGAEDYLRFISKLPAFELFQDDMAKLRAEVRTEVAEWCSANAKTLLRTIGAGEGRSLGLAIAALESRPQPACFAREISLPGVSGKFIEDRMGVIAEILRSVRSPAWREAESIYDQLGLKRTTRLIRAMPLDGSRRDYGLPFDRLLRPTGVERVIVVENLRSFLTLPAIPATLAIYGEGRAAHTLNNLSWLKDVQLYYWGDMDPHGFSILNAIREEYPSVKSVLMNWDSMKRYADLVAPAEPLATPRFDQLTAAEAPAAARAQDGRLGIEQEKIPADAVFDALTSLVTG